MLFASLSRVPNDRRMVGHPRRPTDGPKALAVRQSLANGVRELLGEAAGPASLPLASNGAGGPYPAGLPIQPISLMVSSSLQIGSRSLRQSTPPEVLESVRQ